MHEKMFLRGVLAEFRRTGLEEATFKQVYHQLKGIYGTEGTCRYARTHYVLANNFKRSYINNYDSSLEGATSDWQQ